MKTFSSQLLAAVSTVALFGVLAVTDARAEPTAACTHPALARAASCAAPAGIDANTFIVQPPASTRWLARGGHANADHPAVAVARMQRAQGLDANTFIVQPPVAVTWTVMARDTQLAGAPIALPMSLAH